ncbi:ASCH domain-containing protein [Leeuwenhoekiella blandensis]|nr:ASCH domain-containing protein [Leeuwenhoekiella blandensis]
MVLGFKKQFVEKIKAGSKKHTIREDKKNRWKVGNKIHFATGIRTKAYNQFADGVCTLIEPFEVKYKYEDRKTTANVFVNNELLGQAIWFDCKLKSSSFSVDMLSANDGFTRTNDFFDWFDKDFKGKLIHWDLH